MIYHYKTTTTQTTIYEYEVNPCSDKTGILGNNKVNTMTADALAPCITRSSATMILTQQFE